MRHTEFEESTVRVEGTHTYPGHDRKVSDLVADSELATEVHSRYVQHTLSKWKRSSRSTVAVQVHEKWFRKEEIGRGSFGSVYKETCLRPARKGSIKVRAVKDIRVDRKSKTRAYRELEAIIKFSQTEYAPFFVRCYGWWRTPNAIHIAMEYRPHGDLQRYIKQPLPENQVATITQQVLEGLYYMHSNGFAHRDLKPRNILVVTPGPNWAVQISDFGITKHLDEDSPFSKRRGTIAYMSPEMMGIIDEPPNPFTSDMWSLGLIVYRAFLAKVFLREPDQLQRFCNQEILFPRDEFTANNVSLEAVEFLMALLAPYPAERLSAADARQHGWIGTDVGETQEEGFTFSSRDYIAEEDLIDSNETRNLEPLDFTYGTQTSGPSAAWSSKELGIEEHIIPQYPTWGFDDSVAQASGTSPEQSLKNPEAKRTGGIPNQTVGAGSSKVEELDGLQMGVHGFEPGEPVSPPECAADPQERPIPLRGNKPDTSKERTKTEQQVHDDIEDGTTRPTAQGSRGSTVSWTSLPRTYTARYDTGLLRTGPICDTCNRQFKLDDNAWASGLLFRCHNRCDFTICNICTRSLYENAVKAESFSAPLCVCGKTIDEDTVYKNLALGGCTILVSDWFTQALPLELQYVYAAKVHKDQLSQSSDRCCLACPEDATPVGDNGFRQCEGCSARYCGSCLSLVVYTRCSPLTGYCLVDSWVNAWKNKDVIKAGNTDRKSASSGSRNGSNSKKGMFFAWITS